MTVLAPPLSAAGLPPHAPIVGAPPSRLTRWSKADFMRVDSLLTCGGRRVELLRGEIWDLGPRNTPHAVELTRTRRYLDRTFVGRDVRVQVPLDVSSDSLFLPEFAVVPVVPDDSLSAHPVGRVAANRTAYGSQQGFGTDDSVAPLAAPHGSVKVSDLLP